MVAEQVEDSTDYQPVMHRAATLSAIRREAEFKTKKQAESPIASQEELTDAEKLFEKELGKRNEIQ